MLCHMKHFVVEDPACFLMRLGVLSHFMASRAAHVVLRSSDASSQEVPQVTKTILVAANSFRTPPDPIFQALVLDPIPFRGCNTQPISCRCQMFFCFTSLPDSLRARVLLILCFSGSGGALGTAKKWEKHTNAGFFTPTHTPRAHECLLNSSLIL